MEKIRNMKAEVSVEEPVFSYYGVCSDIDYGCDIEIYANDLRESEVGRKWHCSEQDRYPNRTEVWTVTATLIFIDKQRGFYYLHVEDEGHSEDRMIVVKVHQ